MPVNPNCAPALLATPGIVALWLLDEATAAPGDTVSDSVGTHHGVVTNNGAGVITPLEEPLACDGGTCFRFDQDFVTVAGGIPALDAATEFTFAAWVMRYGGPGGEGLDFGICDRQTAGPGPDGGAALFIFGNLGDPNNDALGLAIYDGASPSPEFVYSTAHVPPGQKSFVGATWKVSTGEVRLYVDAQPPTVATVTQTPPTASRPFLIGLDTVQPSSALGHIDNLLVSTQALSDAEMAALYAACRCARQRSSARLIA